ncbi:MAG: hypothetical protein KF889_14345 [Alphaproteobacteria bacterium]|nr:hypothetical protein [Alphaproteobacteria bacterium]MCW5738822.1 hypothetical protein [Alphaproteobacteria bacterium]
MSEPATSLTRAIEAMHKADTDRALAHVRRARAACADEWLPRDAVLDALLLAVIEEARDPASAHLVAAHLGKAARLLSLLSASQPDGATH